MRMFGHRFLLGESESLEVPSNASCTLLLVCVSVNKSPMTNMAKIAHVVMVMFMFMFMERAIIDLQNLI